MASLLRNALSWLHARVGAVPVDRAEREFGELPASEQHQVWKDLSGTEASGRIFHQGKELFPFSEEHEPSAMVEDSLNTLDRELHKSISIASKAAFMKALQLSPEYVNDRNFRLKFLRAEKFDAKAAAVRMKRHFEEKLKLFGEEALGREILLSDLDEDDMDAMNRGYLQVLSERDRSNRKVIFYYKAISDCYKERENILRTFWYVANTISAEEDVQKLGVVNVVYNLGGFPEHGMDYEKSRRLSVLFRAIPIRFNGFYVCLDESAWVVVVETFSTMISLFLRQRLRMITGKDHQEAQLKLKELGVIPAEGALPVDDSSALLLEAHNRWIEQRQEIEKKQKERENPPHLRSENLTSSLYLQQDLMSNLVKSTSSHYGSGVLGAASNVSENENTQGQAPSEDNIKCSGSRTDDGTVSGKRKAAHRQHSSTENSNEEESSNSGNHDEGGISSKGDTPLEDRARSNRKKSRELASSAEDNVEAPSNIGALHQLVKFLQNWVAFHFRQVPPVFTQQ